MAQLRLAPIFSDNMVLQRDQPVSIWGKAKPDDEIRILFYDEHFRAIAGADSSWSILSKKYAPTVHPQNILFIRKSNESSFLYLCKKLQLISIICLKQLSKIASVFVMFIMLLSIMKTSILYTVYEYDKAFFIELFCVNKDRPQLKCNGHCKLAQMQREENEKNADNILKQLQSEIVYFSPVSMSLIDNDRFLVTNKIQFPSYHNQLYSFLFTAKLIKPPATLLG